MTDPARIRREPDPEYRADAGVFRIVLDGPDGPVPLGQYCARARLNPDDPDGARLPAGFRPVRDDLRPLADPDGRWTAVRAELAAQCDAAGL